MKDYDSLYTGKQIDDAVGAVYGFSKELNNKLDKSEIKPYIIENNEFDTGLNELSVRQNDENETPFSILTVQAPKANPKEATLCLKVPFSGNNADETYFMDISCMNYGNPDESPEQSIYVNSRGNANLPNFNIGFTNNEDQIRHKKLIISPDALPMMFKSDGILVKNTNDPSIHNWADATLIDIRDINKKLDKFTDATLKVYSHGMKEELDFNEYITPTDQAYANTLVMRDRSGKFRSVTSDITSIDNIVATTEFVSSYANEKTVKLEPTNPNQNYDNSIYQVYGHMPLSAAEGIKGNLTYCFNISNIPQFSNIPQYNEEGRLKTNDPFENNDVTNKKYVDNKVTDVQTNMKEIYDTLNNKFKTDIEKSMNEVLEVAEGKTRTIVVNHEDTLQTLKSANSVYIVYPDGNTRDVTNDIKENDYDGYTFGNAVFGNQNDAYIICDFLIFRNNPFKKNSSITSDYYIFQWNMYKLYLNVGDIFLNMLTDVPDFWLQDSTSGKIGILETRKATGSDWEFLGKVAEKTFSKAFTEVKPGKSGIPSGNATVNVTATTYQKKIDGAIVGYKTIVDVTCRCPQFNLNDVGLNVLLSKVGSKWFMPRMAISKGNMNSTKFNVMMDKLNQQKDNVGIAIEDVAIFKDNRGVSGNPGTLNVSGVTNGQVVYDASEFRVFAVMLELDKDNEGKAIPCTGVHYKIVLYHPETIL